MRLRKHKAIVDSKMVLMYDITEVDRLIEELKLKNKLLLRKHHKVSLYKDDVRKFFEDYFGDNCSNPIIVEHMNKLGLFE